jgi:hypothetical protein
MLVSPRVGMVELGEKAPVCEIGILGHILGRLHWCRSNPCSLQACGQHMLVLPARPGRDDFRQLILIVASARQIGEPGIPGQFRLPHLDAQRLPLSLIESRYRDPLVMSADRESVMWAGKADAIAVWRWIVPALASLEDFRADKLHRRLDLRHFNILPG